MKQKHITISQELRLKAVHLKQDHQDWSTPKLARRLAAVTGLSADWWQNIKGINDQQRSGRPLKADADAQQYIYMAAQLPECSSVADVAAKTQQELGLKMSPNTFRLHAMGRPAGRWCTPATRGTVAKPKHSIAAHVYMGISYHGTTSLKFVIGTHKQVSKYTNPKTNLPHKGVAKDECTDVLRDHFIPEGNKLFQHSGKWADNWKLQQDNAPPHKTATNMAFIADHVPARHFL